ncbi:vitamin K epoxide reductase family protein [Streptomyces sp. bgisy100]|uniref:vitamin K epoxide reductase family protein n=1 Tax=Streptomyces sp. bgisy100 TaxID=3413783 RepID=UPI003D731046
MATTVVDDVSTDEHDPEHPSGGAVGSSRALAWLLVITGAAGLLAAWVVTLDKIELLKNPEFQPGCNFNSIVSCGSIMESDQASAFGFPNPMLGLVTYGMVIAIGMGLVAGARYPRWFWLGLNAGTLFGVGFCTWLQYQSLYVIGSLCVWCCLAWVATIVMFCYVTLHNIRNRFLPAPEGLRNGLLEFHWVPPVLWIGIIGMLVLTRWWSVFVG